MKNNDGLRELSLDEIGLVSGGSEEKKYPEEKRPKEKYPEEKRPMEKYISRSTDSVVGNIFEC